MPKHPGAFFVEDWVAKSWRAVAGQALFVCPSERKHQFSDVDILISLLDYSDIGLHE